MLNECPECGTKRIMGYGFCAECGFQFDAEATSLKNVELSETIEQDLKSDNQKEEVKELIGKIDKEISQLEEKPDEFFHPKTPTITSESVKGGKIKKSWMGRYYANLLHKKPIIWLLIIGGVVGCILSVYLISVMCHGSIACWGEKWWWVPLSTSILGPVGLVVFALILPLLPYIIYGVLYVIFMMIISIGS